MSTLKADTISAATTDGDLTVQGDGTGVPDLAAGVKVGGSTLLPVSIANGGTGSTSTTYCNLTSNVTGTLPVADGGTGSTSTTYCNLTSNVTGTLPVGNGGTGATSLTLNSALLGNGTSAPLEVAPSTSGNVLTSNGTTWQSTTPAGGGGTALITATDVTNVTEIEIEDCFSSTYNNYIIFFTGIGVESGLNIEFRYVNADDSLVYDYIGTRLVIEYDTTVDGEALDESRLILNDPNNDVINTDAPLFSSVIQLFNRNVLGTADGFASHTVVNTIYRGNDGYPWTTNKGAVNIQSTVVQSDDQETSLKTGFKLTTNSHGNGFRAMGNLAVYGWVLS